MALPDWSVKEPTLYESDDRPAFAVKEVTEEGSFTGYASIFGKRDLQDDIVESGAFKRSLKQKKAQFPLLWQHDRDQPIGLIEAAEDKRGLKVEGQLTLGVTRANDTLALMRSKVVTGLSIGYRTVKDEVNRDTGVRHLKEVELWEVSAVVFPANPLARIRSVKDIVPYQNLPLADPARAWDASAATGRVRSSTDSGEEPSARYKKGFVWYDAEASESYGSYKLPIADVIDGKLTAVPRAIFAAAAAVQGARGGVKIPASDIAGVQNHLAKYYRKMDRSPPWESSASFEEQLRMVMELLPFADERHLKDLRAFLDSQPNSTAKADFDWLEGFAPELEPKRNAAEAFQFLDKYTSGSE